MVDKTKLPENDTLVFTAIIDLSDNPLEYDFQIKEPPKVSNLTLVKSSSGNKTIVVDGQNRYQRIYTMEYLPTTIGMAYINPAYLTVYHKPTQTTKILTTERLSIEVKEPVLPKNYKGLLIALVVIILLSSILVVAYFLVRRRKNQKEDDNKSRIVLEQLYLEKVKELRDMMAKGDITGFFDLIPLIMRDYLSEKFSIPAKGMASSELLGRLESLGIGGKDLSSLSESLAVCDRIRFARESASEMDAQKVLGAFEKLLSNFTPVKNIEDNKK
jgi:hypothetical protein